MTCIAWDGETLAADKRVTYQGLARTVTKIFRVGKSLIAISGEGAQGMEMLDWWKNGALPANYPLSQRDKETWQAPVVTMPWQRCI